ncbi:DNA damage-inducible transcript 4-like protein [Engraulis encrasicolus]|uniref:DNA damage-inducible transcript 4-like protein n=1 Tax=Engraulis encrasicolus TaxID=184585 RepID=UPI002FD3EEFD
MVATSTLKNKTSECTSAENYDRRYDHNYIEDELDFWERCLADPPAGTSSLLTSSSSSTSSSSRLHSHSQPEESLESSACKQLALLLEQCLARAKRSTLHCAEVLVPETLTRRMARDALRLAASEPCGLRGCVLHVQLESAAGSAEKKNGIVGGGGGACKRLERIVCDASVTPTFELTLVFKQDGGGWPSLRDVLLIGAACFAPGFYRHALKLSPGFRLIKRKLYSSSPAGTIVEEY